MNRLNRPAGALLITALLTAGCGTAGPKSAVNERDSGQLVVTYRDATTPAAREGRTLMTNSHMLDNMAEYVNGYLALPYPVELVGAQCDEANAYWSAADKRITVCYEYVNLILKLFETDTDQHAADPAKAAVNAAIATAYHELGHAVISVYDLPTTGRHEDAADQFAAYLWLVPDENMQNDAPQVVEDFADMFKLYSATRSDLVVEDFADEHSLDWTRMYNLTCWVYGSNPAAHSDLVKQVGLPKGRADRCEYEFRAIVKAWKTLLAPHLKS
ncbi:MAG: DUF4344 domain-containing metallopeptidase [Mycobacteriaceae bacterium]